MLVNPGGIIAAQEKLPIFGASFDGTNDYLTGGALTGAADGKLGIFACKFRMLGGDGSSVFMLVLKAAANRFDILRHNTNTMRIRGFTSAGVQNLGINTVGTITADGNYHTILVSWDIGTDDNHQYIDGVSDISVVTSDNTNIDYTGTDASVGADPSGGFKSNIDINALYLNIAEKIDFSVAANRLKFFDAAGKWVPSRYGDGSEPTGTAPIIYMPLPYTGFNRNLGPGGTFAVTGALTEPAS